MFEEKVEELKALRADFESEKAIEKSFQDALEKTKEYKSLVDSKNRRVKIAAEISEIEGDLRGLIVADEKVAKSSSLI